MSEDQTTQPTEREELEARANQLGLKFHPNIGDDKLREKVNAALTGSGDDQGDDEEDQDAPVAETQAPTKRQSANDLRLEQKRKASELVRVRVTCMNPNKSEYEGEVFAAGNRIVGTFKKYVPFDTEWHVPRIIFNMIKNRKCQVFVKKRDERGRQKTEGKLIKEFSVEELPPLTEKELKELANRQAMAKGTASA